MDGVLIDSKGNMSKSWNEVKKVFSIKISFKKYFQNIGRPFQAILKKLKIDKKKYKQIEKVFRETSTKNINFIKFYPGVRKSLISLVNQGHKIGILTSKDKFRTKKIIKRLKVNFLVVICPKSKNIGKPNPKILNDEMYRIPFKKNEITYVGDTIVDYKFSKRANINFIFADYGYGKLDFKKIKKIKKIKKFQDIIKIDRIK